VLRRLEANIAEPHPLVDLAETAGLSRYRFLRTFKWVTGVTPHQWLLRARPRAAAKRLVSSRDAVTDIARRRFRRSRTSSGLSRRVRCPAGRYRAAM
jgi:transcriptional regulator GlxA family with amidase domain